MCSAAFLHSCAGDAFSALHEYSFVSRLTFVDPFDVLVIVVVMVAANKHVNVFSRFVSSTCALVASLFSFAL